MVCKTRRLRFDPGLYALLCRQAAVTSYQTDDSVTAITAKDSHGFTVNNISMRGSVIAFPSVTFLWDMPRADSITPESLSIVELMKPKIGTYAPRLPHETD